MEINANSLEFPRNQQKSAKVQSDVPRFDEKIKNTCTNISGHEESMGSKEHI